MGNHTIEQVKQLLMNLTDENDPQFRELEQDERKGVKILLEKWHRERKYHQHMKARFEEMSHYEKQARDAGFRNIAGVDEAGRGPLAGPVVSAAVILPEGLYLEGLDDSKKLTEKKRVALYRQIKEAAIAVGVGIVSEKDIDSLNIYHAARKSMNHAVNDLSVPPDYLLVDAMDLQSPYPSESIIKGDAKSISIAAASIIAKVTRDKIMDQYDSLYPQYGFSLHKGYGTKTHLHALHKYGPTPIHRKSFGPVASASAKGGEMG
ncbi:MAG TPA: ribonuclease HII [Bacillaceae bacterium]